MGWIWSLSNHVRCIKVSFTTDRSTAWNASGKLGSSAMTSAMPGCCFSMSLAPLLWYIRTRTHTDIYIYIIINISICKYTYIYIYTYVHTLYLYINVHYMFTHVECSMFFPLASPRPRLERHTTPPPRQQRLQPPPPSPIASAWGFRGLLGHKYVVYR